MKDTARDWSNTIMKRLPPTPNYTGIEKKDRFYYGFLGELAFEELLRVRHKKAIHKVILNGKSQDEDFLCSFLIGDKKVDIKTSPLSYARWMLFPKSQYAEQGYIYVGVRLQEGFASIMGWCLYSDMNKDLEIQKALPIPTNHIAFDKMNDINNLVSKMIDGELKVNLII